MPDLPPAPKNSPLTFDWRRPRAEWPRLFFWTLLTALGLTGFFALFRVVYPQAQRVVPTEQQITLLGSDPAAQSIIKAVQDRDFLVIPAREGMRNPVSLEERAPVFHPSYERHELRLLDLPEHNARPAPVRLLDVREPVLPRLDLSELKPEALPKPARPKKLALQLRGELAGRGIVSQPGLETISMAEPESWRFHLGVDGAGQVVFALPFESPGKPDEAAPLLRLLRQIRFTPEPTPEKSTQTVWGEAALIWSSTPG